MPKTMPRLEAKTDLNGGNQQPSAPHVEGLPLFFSNPVPVNPERHGKAAIQLTPSLEFARTTNSLPLNAVELPEAARHYPIAFTLGETPMPVALVGLEQTNLFIETDGTWRKDHYVPAYVRKHPFIFAQEPGGDQLTLCVEEDYPHFMHDAKGENVAKLFEAGKPTAYTNNALSFCSAFQQDYLATQRFCDTLNALNLFEPNRSDIELAGGRKIALAGFQLIDQKRFSQLPDDAILDLHKQGMLPLVYAALFSTSNWQRLLTIANEMENQR